MKLRDIKEITKSEVILGKDKLDLEISVVCGADLMSDVLTFSAENTLLLTGLTKPQVIRTAEMLELSAIIFVRGKKPNEQTVQLAKESGIPLLYTEKPLYETCGRLYEAGLKSDKLKGE
ncbi:MULTISPECIES: DRTGG domain-containing protein [unclassified Candidatus Frackibacter]|uniref:DRTGG domain-containing protein n=1 Tax=unclassified Candidatus Frackibacter TaxID=2648818 RepID=UPI0007934A9A|nr:MULTISPECIES: DRTGG domain-containing protein [unclassified Candidatus Frackibacter]KXS36727.1 MAG: DRTGG domain-containing protein [Candidatus Frackibacter sp. T328-2]SDC41988.1 DRTGG domain-containing protein [Candidatus Frackibacter sp. WG11]SEM59065.1 DRTGG domain-containing protein [Candidatus Frackibacter sp. WG12]SFL63031.1 DRTGG domain-containing protein [Candidatus Frackibacter sp. WG13]